MHGSRPFITNESEEKRNEDIRKGKLAGWKDPYTWHCIQNFKYFWSWYYVNSHAYLKFWIPAWCLEDLIIAMLCIKYPQIKFYWTIIYSCM